MSSDLQLLLFASLFARFTGFFVLSPLFIKRGIPAWARLGLALSCSFLLLPPLSTQLSLKISSTLLFSVELLQELAIGYLLGFLFSLLFEAAAFAGQLIGTLAGFSATELLDPLSNSEHPLVGRLFSLTLFALFLALDLHHTLLRLLFESYLTLSPYSAISVFKGTSHLFTYALSFALFPMAILLCVILCFATLARFFPALQIFWTGLPIQLLIGIGAIAFTIGFFGQILQGAFNELWTLAKRALFPL